MAPSNLETGLRSFHRKPDNRRAVYLDLVGSVESQLRQAYAWLSERGLETQASLAEKLGVNRSAVHRRLTGGTNMTLRVLADMIWALGFCIKIDIFHPSERSDNEPRVVPVHPKPTITVRSNTPQIYMANAGISIQVRA